uniref:Methenyltetrahydrofolate synthase domain-containing protein n=1 Tax=Pinctada fucata TaxID=50426 RepID=A0A194AJT7_PINFU
MPPKQTKTPAESVLDMGKEVTKEAIRKSVWNYLEDNDLVQFPRPVFNRIPNFIGAATAAEKMTTMDEFKQAKTVKINPDKPQENARFLTMEANKTLLVPTPRLRHGLFNKLLPPPGCSKEILRYCSTSQGLKEYSVPIGLEAKVKVDLVVIGSVAVSKEGFRIGKGEGFADLEYAMMVSMGAVSDDTIVVTTVHDTQIMDIPESLMEEHDLLVDYIVTETQVIKCNRTRPKPKGIIWNRLTPEKVRQVPILKHLRDLEKEAGKDVTLKDGREEEDIPAREERGNRDDDRPGYRYRYRRNRRFGGRFRGGGGGRGGSRRRQDTNESGELHENGEVSEGGAGDDDKPKPRMRRNRRFRRRGGPPRRRDDGDHEESHEEDGHTNEEDDDGDRRPPRRRNMRRRRPRTRQESENTGDEEGMSRPPRRRRNPRMRPPIPTIFVGSIQRSVRVSELKSEIRGKDVNPIRVIWNGAKGYSLLQFQEMQEMESALDALANLEIRGRKLRVEVSNRLKQGDGDHDSDADGPYEDNQHDD